eukprot:CAMPEP_0204365156 /NCGR_PEP_ID=MMETSP0469-20131031/41695_1 /ASSEMBLY_ACC=CAM_ASM_000384 /TAXON_ID=2969 /ORGANISM="Oxyrrhis marina" /LENGTH=52 /DNA_ID=CAMNT_0051354181 /DNA_START=22 /DNA_END=176 /DNA_ORIENTATION=-
MTHVILFSVEVAPSGDLTAQDRLPKGDIASQIQEARSAAGMKVLFCVGGAGR